MKLGIFLTISIWGPKRIADEIIENWILFLFFWNNLDFTKGHIIQKDSSKWRLFVEIRCIYFEMEMGMKVLNITNDEGSKGVEIKENWSYFW